MVTENKRIAIIGAGLMGHGIAQAFAQKGHEVRIFDVYAGILEAALGNVRSNLETFVAAGVAGAETVEDSLGRISAHERLEHAVAGSDFIIEAAPEDMNIKRELFDAVSKIASSHAILASNTSMLPISEFGASVIQQDKLVITHWFNPPHIIPVVEVVAGPTTSEETMSTTVELLEQIGKQPVRIAREIPGFLVNRIQTAMFREVLSLLEKKLASPEDLDRAVKGSFGLRLGVIGVLETMDLAGLDLMLKGTEYLYPRIDKSTRPNEILKHKVAEGHLGVKSGRGFFPYADQASGQSSRESIKKRDLQLLKLVQE